MGGAAAGNSRHHSYPYPDHQQQQQGLGQGPSGGPLGAQGHAATATAAGTGQPAASRQHYPPHADLMSMAERGCLGLAASSNGSTSSGSTSCSEEDKMLRHREGRGHHHQHHQTPGNNLVASRVKIPAYIFIFS